MNYHVLNVIPKVFMRMHLIVAMLISLNEVIKSQYKDSDVLHVALLMQFLLRI